MPHHSLRRGAALTTLAVLGLGAAAPAAHAQEAAAPTSVEVVVTGPATGQAGGTGEFPVTVSNTGERPTRELRLSTQLPEGITVRSVSASDDWTCVLGPLRCTLQRQLPAGAQTGLSMELHYDGLVEGRQEIAVVVSQTSDGPARFDRGTTVVDVEGEPEPEPEPAPEPPAPQQPAPQEPAPQEPAPQQPAPQQPAPQQPVAAPAPAPAPAAPRRAAAPAPADPAPAPAPVEPAPADPAPADPAPVEQPPAVLPFADTDDESGSASDEDADDSAVATGGPDRLVPAGDSTAYTAALAVVFAVSLMTIVALLVRIAARRRGLIA